MTCLVLFHNEFYQDFFFSFFLMNIFLRTFQHFTVAEERVKTLDEMTERERYEMLCRGEVTIPPEVQKNLKCRYVDRGIPFLKIAPFKEEEAYLDPRIVVYHNVIYDDEIETIKRMAQPRVTFDKIIMERYKLFSRRNEK